mgnify:CR=1 FL=1
MKVFPKGFAIWFKDLERWDPASFHGIDWHWPSRVMVPIGSILRMRKEKVDRNKYPFSTLQPITIHFDGSIERRDIDGNREYSMDLYFARPGDIVVAKIDLKNGAVGILPDWGNAVVTGHFAVYEPDRARLLPEYFERLIQADFFKAYLWRNKVGAEGRKEVKLDFFESIEIPLPPRSVQQSIVQRWKATQDEIAAIRSGIVKRQEEIDIGLLKKIGINIQVPKLRKGAFALTWDYVERWDTFFYREDFIDLENQLSKLNAKPLEKVMHFISRPWKRADFPKGTFRYIEISSVTKEQGIIGYREVSIDEPPSRATTLVKAGDILLSTTRPYLGAFTIVLQEYDNSVCTSAFALADSVNEEVLDKKFLLYFLRSSAGLRQMERRMTGGLYPAIVQSELEKIRLPLPPLKSQKAFVQAADEIQTQIKEDRKSSETKADVMKTQIEEMILGIRPVP